MNSMENPDIKALLLKAREQAFNEAAAALAAGYAQAERWQFINDVLCIALESGPYGSWMTVVKYNYGNDNPNLGVPLKPASATIIEAGDDLLTPAEIKAKMDAGGDDIFDITHETIDLGLRRIRLAEEIDPPDNGTGYKDETSVPFLSRAMRNKILACDLMNEAADIDVVLALAILEVALFNEIRYN